MPLPAQTRAGNSVSADVDRLLSPKSLEDLDVLEKQISAKLRSDEAIDVEYWEQLLRNVSVYKSRAELNTVYKTIIESKLAGLRADQRTEALTLKNKLTLVLSGLRVPTAETYTLSYRREIDSEPLLKIRTEDKSLNLIDEQDFLDKNVSP